MSKIKVVLPHITKILKKQEIKNFKDKIGELYKRISSFLVILQTKYKDNKVETSKFLFIINTKRYKQADK